MYDNKVRLSQDVLEKASEIASEWGLKNARAAVEAVFRRYADDYLTGGSRRSMAGSAMESPSWTGIQSEAFQATGCEALNALDDLLGL